MSRRIAHLSDFHFGAEDPQLVEPLLVGLGAARPHLVVVSGDLTQRATRRQFGAARELLRAIEPPKLVVPGNHDIPLLDLVSRFGAPRRRWDRWLGLPWLPAFRDDEVMAIGLDSPRPWRSKEGAISSGQLERVRALSAEAPAHLRRIVVTHHPLAPARAAGRHALALGARRARQALRDCGTDIVLSGHLHVSGMRGLADAERKGLVFLQCPSTLSHRLRGERNGYYVLDLEPGRLVATLMSYEPSREAFVPAGTVEHALAR